MALRCRVFVLLLSLEAFGCAERRQLPRRFVNSLGMTMVLVDPTAHPGPGPTLPYFLSSTEVTNAELEALRPRHRTRRPVGGADDRHPATQVSFAEAEIFAARLSARERRLYRIPTEAEWEWAAQAGERHQRYATASGSLSHDLANYAGTGGQDRFPGPAPVASFPANPLGLHDMTGNVWEWCADWYEPEPHAHRVWLWTGWFPKLQLPAAWYGTMHKWRVLRGGSYLHEEPLQRIAVRNAYSPHHRSASWGFRLALPAAGYR